MPPAPERTLTDRQSAVMERIDRRVPIKVIAQELGVSETRINQHIRALKDIFRAESLNELVETYRATLPQDETNGDLETAENGLDEIDTDVSGKPFSEAAYIKNQLHGSAGFPDSTFRSDPGQIIMNDAMSFAAGAPWLRADEPRIVPGVLDGEHAVLFRFAAIIGISFGVVAAVVLAVTAAVSISEALDGRLSVPTEEIEPAT